MENKPVLTSVYPHEVDVILPLMRDGDLSVPHIQQFPNNYDWYGNADQMRAWRAARKVQPLR
jgi:hypothetical protein